MIVARILTIIGGIAGLAALPAATLSVDVAAAGRPAADAVVTLHASGRPTPAARSGAPLTVEQRDIQFHPFVSVVPEGGTVSFPNFDPVRHHVYSFSPTKRFELKLYAKDQTRTVQFEKAGIVAVGCNIHDSMSAYLFVTDSAWTAKVDAAGRANFAGLPPGAYVLSVWHPYLRAPGNRIDQPVEIGTADRREAVTIALRSPPLHDKSGY